MNYLAYDLIKKDQADDHILYDRTGIKRHHCFPC